MPANTAPIFTLVPNVGWGEILTANTAKDGTGTVVLLFTAGSNGSYLQKVRAKAKGTNTASVLRLWGNNGSTNATAGNNYFIGEITLAATTLSEVAATAENEYMIDVPIPAGHRVYATIGTTVAAGWQLSAYGGDY